MIVIDHIAMPARDAAASARFLADILGIAPATPTGPDGEMRLLAIDERSSLLYDSTPTGPALHLAFRVDAATFAAIVARLRARGVAFGNHHEDPTNGETADRFGGAGRVYFLDPSGHLFEIVA